MGFKGVPLDAPWEAEAAAPGAVAELAQQRGAAPAFCGRGLAIAALRGGGGGGCGGGGRRLAAALGTDDQGPVRGLDVNGGAVDARELEGDGVGVLGFVDLGGGHTFGRLQLLLQPVEQIEGGGMKRAHGWCFRWERGVWSGEEPPA